MRSDWSGRSLGRSAHHPGAYVIGWRHLPENVARGARIVAVSVAPCDLIVHAVTSSPDLEIRSGVYRDEQDYHGIALVIAEAQGREPGGLEPDFLELGNMRPEGKNHGCLAKAGERWFWGIGSATAEGAVPIAYGWEATDVDAWLARQRVFAMPSGKTETHWRDGTVHPIPIGFRCQLPKGHDAWFARQMLDGIRGRERKRTKSTGSGHGPIFEHWYDSEDRVDRWHERRITRVAPKSVFVQGRSGSFDLPSEVRLDRSLLEGEGSCRHEGSRRTFYTAAGRAAAEARWADRSGGRPHELQVLGLDAADLSDEAIRSAFRVRAREIHTDAGGSGDGAAMAALVAARDKLLQALTPGEAA